jgi:large subunit ribosomal protein L31
MKKNIHPNIYLTKIYCNDVCILKINTTKEKLNVNIWSGNHPFYKQSKEILDMEGQIEKFEKKYKKLN